MSDDKLIRLSDAIAALTEVAVRFGITGEPQIMILAKEALRAIPAVQPSPDVAALVGKLAAKAERDRIIEGLRDEADLTPCDEDAVVVRDCADLIEADFSYEDAERLKEARLKGGAA